MHHKSSNIMQSLTMNQSPIADVTMESDQNNNNENRSNNNLTKEKYSLRQRGQRKLLSNRSKSSAADLSASSHVNNSNAADNDKTKNSKSKLKDKVTKEKPKQRAAPLSKYRRKTANARERTRMREINHAFETLRHAVPVVISGAQSQSVNEKLTKITTLRMAMKYIKILNDIIENKAEASDGLIAALNGNDELEKSEMFSMSSMPSPSPSTASTSSSSSSSYLSFSTTVNNKTSKEKLKSNGNVLAQNHHDYCKEIASAKTTKTSKVSTSSKKTSKANTNNNANKVAKKPSTPKSSAKSTSKMSRNSNKSQKHQPPLLAPPSKQRHIQRTNKRIQSKLVNHLLGSGNLHQAMLHSTTLNSINCSNATTNIAFNNKINNNMLHCLSKYDLSPCLTPPNDDSPADLGLILESDGESLQLSEPCFSPLELGLLLESDGESLHLSEPCLSPLNHLDALNSFNDLLHGSFNEPNSLDLYLS